MQVLRLFLVWDSEGIAESEDKVLEEIFESVDADDGDNDSDDDSGSSGDDRKKPKKGVKIEKKSKKRKKSNSSDDESLKSVDSSGSEASLGVIIEHPWTFLSKTLMDPHWKKYIHTTGATNFENSGWFVVKMWLIFLAFECCIVH